MAIKNSMQVMGGTDWKEGDKGLYVDFNDTFNKIATLVNNGN